MRNQIYGGKRPRTYKLAHNHILHTANMQHGTNGFRRFWIPPEWIGWHWVKCKCGWRPDMGTHYRVRGSKGNERLLRRVTE
jgi:hypothetical protein